MEKIKVGLEAQYNGHSIKKNGSVDLSFKIPYSNLMDCVKLLQLLSVNIHVKANINGIRKFPLGTFYLDKLVIDREGESTIKFNSEIDSVELDNLTELTQPEIIIKLMCMGSVDSEEESEEIEE